MALRTAAVSAGLALANVAGAIAGRSAIPSEGAGHFHHEMITSFLASNLPAHALLVGINVIAARRPRSPGVWRALAYASAVLLSWASITGIWLWGSLTAAAAIVFAHLLIAAYRVLYDGRVGVVALVS
ncbi:MAG: hypothetical protein JWN04_328, partial [Myxococcaceae bacterium]|nr:hypothetical protein [Myxococcaceae bacterium]